MQNRFPTTTGCPDQKRLSWGVKTTMLVCLLCQFRAPFGKYLEKINQRPSLQGVYGESQLSTPKSFKSYQTLTKAQQQSSALVSSLECACNLLVKISGNGIKAEGKRKNFSLLTPSPSLAPSFIAASVSWFSRCYFSVRQILTRAIACCFKNTPAVSCVQGSTKRQRSSREEHALIGLASALERKLAAFALSIQLQHGQSLSQLRLQLQPLAAN